METWSLLIPSLTFLSDRVLACPAEGGRVVPALILSPVLSFQTRSHPCPVTPP